MSPWRSAAMLAAGLLLGAGTADGQLANVRPPGDGAPLAPDAWEPRDNFEPELSDAERRADWALEKLAELEGVDVKNLGSSDTLGVYEWNWGELVFDRQYQTSLDIHNLCRFDVWVDVLVGSGLTPLIRGARTAVVDRDSGRVEPSAGGGGLEEQRVLAPALKDLKVTFDVQTPRRPPPDESVDPADVFEQIDGHLIVKPSLLNEVSCVGIPRIYRAGGHIHLDPTGSGGEDCFRFWMMNRMPEPPQDCTIEFRRYALDYVRSLRTGDGPASSGRWSWLPTAAQIGTMDAGELLAMKMRAETQRLEMQP